MSRVCEVCGKKPQFGHNVSHAHNVTNRRWNPNLQRIKVNVNGSTRRMTVQPAAICHHVKGADASPRASRAAETRAQRHPNLLPVWDTEAQAIRSVNLATVSRIAVYGTVHTFSAGH